MDKILYLDVEFVNMQNKSICQIGILKEAYPSCEPLFPEKNILINPEDGFHPGCIKVNGITPEMVANCPNFKDTWDSIKDYFTDSVIVGHNVASSDLSALANSCARYNIELPKLCYIDTLDIAKDVMVQTPESKYTLESLCKYFDLDLDNHHNALGDACAARDLFKLFVDKFNINPNNYIKLFTPKNADNFITYVTDNELKNTMYEFYGVIEGFGLDKKVQAEEIKYIKDWRDKNLQYSSMPKFRDIFYTLDKILKDGIITMDELCELKICVRQYCNKIKGALITNSIKELRGILKGIITDNKILTLEGENLLNWLYENSYLRGHEPYDCVLSLFKKQMDDGIITKDESELLMSEINKALNPVENLSKKLLSIPNKHICLSGNFEHGPKEDIIKLIEQKGGIIDTNVKKTTEILVMGGLKCDKFAHGNYGTKFEKAKKMGIDILTEGNFFEILKETESVKL